MALHAAASDAAGAVSGAWRELRYIHNDIVSSPVASPQTQCSWCRFTRPRCTATTSATRASTPRARRCPSSTCCGKRMFGALAAQQRQLTRLTRAARGSRAEADWEGGDIPSANADRLRGVGAGALAGMLSGFRQLAGLL